MDGHFNGGAWLVTPEELTEDAPELGRTRAGDAAPPGAGVEERIDELKSKFRVVFDGLGETDLVEHEIPTGDAKPVRVPGYRLPAQLLPDAREQIRKMKDKGIVGTCDPKKAEWAFPPVLIRKKDGSTRLAIDFRRLNTLVPKDAFPMPRADEILDDLNGKAWFSCLDFRSGYWQIKLAEKDQHKTAFWFDQELLYFRRLPFGLSQAGATFNRFVQKLLGGVKNCRHFVDDVIVSSATLDEHIEDLERVFKILKDEGVTLNEEKCSFAKKKVEFLGMVIEEGTIRPSPEKVAAVRNFPRPKSVKELRRYLGLTNFYRGMIKDYAVIVAPLYSLTGLSPKAAFPWRAEHQKAFEESRDALCAGVQRQMPDLTKPFTVRVDASALGVGAMLLQGDRLIECASKKFPKEALRYAVIEQEAYGIMFAIDHWRHFLLGAKFEVQCDHRPLAWLQSKKDAHGKLGRWALRLAEYDFSIKHIPGRENVDADCLSRAFVAAVAPADMAREQTSDPEIMKAMEADPKERFTTAADGRIFFRGEDGKSRLCLPAHFRRTVWQELHENFGHLGAARMRQLIDERFWWPRLRQDVKRLAKGCRACAIHKDLTPAPSAVPLDPVDPADLQPMERVAVDAVGPFQPDSDGNKYLLVAVDYFSRYVEAEPVKALGGKVLVNFFSKFSARYGFPRELVMDQGADNQSKEFREFCEKVGIKQRFIAPYHHQSNMGERSHRSILNSLRASGAEENWSEKLPCLLYTSPSPRDA